VMNNDRVEMIRWEIEGQLSGPILALARELITDFKQLRIDCREIRAQLIANAGKQPETTEAGRMLRALAMSIADRLEMSLSGSDP
jgi:hypothetical protein